MEFYYSLIFRLVLVLAVTQQVVALFHALMEVRALRNVSRVAPVRRKGGRDPFFLLQLETAEEWDMLCQAIGVSEKLIMWSMDARPDTAERVGSEETHPGSSRGSP